MIHLFTLTTDGDLFNVDGRKVAHFQDYFNISTWLCEFRAAYGREVVGEIIREADIWAWEAAVVARAEGELVK